MGAQLLQNAGILAEHISIPTSITATPAALNLGELYTGVQVSKELLLTGFGLSPETGNVSVTATTNLMISTDNENFASTAQASYAGSTLFQRIYIHALYSEEGEQHDTLVITSGNTLIEVSPALALAVDHHAEDIHTALLYGEVDLMSHIAVARGINDDLAHAAKLVDALRGLDCRVNLIRFHESPEAPFKPSMPSTIAAFQSYLNSHSLICTLLASRGQDIEAACGLLAGKAKD